MKEKPVYRIGAVAALTGLSPHVLRAWERRYDGAKPERSPRGGRLYTEEDVERFRLLKELRQVGHAMGTVAGLPLAELGRLVAEHGPRVAAPDETLRALRDRFLAAVTELDLPTAQALLGRAVLGLEPNELVLWLLAPLLAEVGERWQAGRLRVAHEHAISALVRSLLGSLVLLQQVPADAPIAIASTLSGELHELGALLAGFLAARAGWRVVYLGPDLPADEVVFAVARCKAGALLLSMVHADAGAELDRLLEKLPARVKVILGGPLARAAARGRRRVTVADDLKQLEGALARARA